jgi:hypothetical protein
METMLVRIRWLTEESIKGLKIPTGLTGDDLAENYRVMKI